MSKAEVSKVAMARASFGKAIETEKGKHYNFSRFPEDASEVVEGIVEAFLNKQRLAPGEVQCLKQGSRDIASDVMTVAQHIVMLTQKLLGMREVVPGLEKYGVSGQTSEKHSPSPTPAPPPPPIATPMYAERRLQSENLMTASAVIMEFGFSMQKVAALSHQIVHTCLRKDGLEAMETAAEHFMDMEYMGEHVIVNGADVCAELADGVAEWNGGNRIEFGHQLGTALRKVILSSKNITGKLPKGNIPSSAILVNITSAFLESFFGPGMMLEVHLFSDGSQEDHFRVNLHKCFGENADVLEKIWSSIVVVYGKAAKRRRDANLGKTAEQQEEDVQSEKDEFKKVLAYNLVQLPTILEKCHVSKERQEMLKGAFTGLGYDDGMTFGFRGVKERSDAEEENQLARSIRSWEDLQKDGGLSFGHELGKFTQGLITTMFPQKYSTDELGNLVEHTPGVKVLPFALLGCLVLLVSLFAFVFIRRRRPSIAQLVSVEEPEEDAVVA